MRRSLLRLCSKIDLDGNPSKYYPRFRPRRLVMPVDPADVHSAARQPSPLYEVVKAQQRRRRQAERRGAVQLGTVPAERSVGDAFRLLLEACATQQLFSDSALTPAAVRDLADLVAALQTAQGSAKTPSAATTDAQGDAGAASAAVVFTSPLYAVAFHSSRGGEDNSSSSCSNSPSVDAPSPLPPAGDPRHRHRNDTLSVREVDTLWAMLDHTPLNAPVHGALALRGEALVRATLLELAYEAYPRLRSKHVQQLLHETTGLLPCGRIATRLGFAEHCGVEGDIAMWRELNTLTERLRIARRQAAAHLQRVEKGVAAQRRWYWRAVLRSAAGRLKLFPVHRDELQPRLAWVRSSLFAFIAFVEVAEQSGDAQARVRPLIYHLFASQLARQVRRRRVLDAAAAIVEAQEPGAGDAAAATAAATVADNSAAASHAMAGAAAEEGADVARLTERLTVELARVRGRTQDEEEVMEGRIHPLNRRADRTREQFESSGGGHGTQALVDSALQRHEAAHARLAPPLLLHALEATTANAFKEAQLVLRYAPETAASLRHAPIDVDQSVRRIVEVEETNNYASLHHAQQYHQVEYTVCRLYAGRHCLGEGKGETLMSAMQDASLEMLFRYYFHTPNSAAASPLEAHAAAHTGGGREDRASQQKRSTVAANSESAAGAIDREDAGIPAARIHAAKTEEEFLL